MTTKRKLAQGIVRLSRTTAITTAAICAAATITHAGLADCTAITTDKGAVTGVKNDRQNVCIYRGIPYAAPPVGDLRFAPPAPPAPWKDTLDASKFGGECPQFPMSLAPSKTPVGTEDCLYLNVWQPYGAATAKKAVMVFIHGGGFTLGSGSQTWYESSKLANTGDVIVVTINYRLGLFGFLTHPAFAQPDGSNGNWGMLDQVQALKWVKNNIANFGGDPDNITIFGESAGGMSVSSHLVSPMSKGLFHKAIAESGPTFVMNRTIPEAEKTATALAAKLGCSDPATAAKCLRSLDALPALIAVNKSDSSNPVDAETSNANFFPIADGKFLPESPLKLYLKGHALDIPLIIGTNRDEASIVTLARTIKTSEDMKNALDSDLKMVKDMFGIQLPVNDFVSLYSPEKYPSPKDAYVDLLTDGAFTCVVRPQLNYLAKNKNPLYAYLFARPITDRDPTAKALGVFHGAELAYVFNNFKFFTFNLYTKEGDEFSKKIMTLWANFAKTGTPSAPGFPTWPRYDAQQATMLRIQDNSDIITNYKSSECLPIEKLLIDSYAK